jgi:methyl-accepting chemotaxis protein
MAHSSAWLRFLPRSLWLQTLLLLAVALAASSVTAGPYYWSRYNEEFTTELARRGSTTVETLEKHSDLRLAIALADGNLAAPILRSVAEGDDDLRYVAILDPQKKPITFAPITLGATEFERELTVHHLGLAGDPIKRFNQEVRRGDNAPTAGLDFPDQIATDKKPATLGYVVLGLDSARAKSRALRAALSSVGAWTLGLFSALIVLYMGWVASRLSRMGQFAEAVAAGELTHRLDDHLDDDLGRLAEALRSMSHRTGTVVAQLVQAASSLSSASAEVFYSSSRQSSNAARQASSVSEMGATVAELRETFNQATAKAESVIELARHSEESSSGGAEAVRESIEGMKHIRDQVAAIANTISGLVQRTDQIDAIIDVVNDLAEQSNVLALNAGIEAARAGEHGRGFAVVAREVRSLAERSKESTSQVRAILQDIKLAGREAVRAIEEGSRRAESGMEVANAAGVAIKRLGDAIAASSASAMQIASSTRQQSVGVEQIWQATKEIDRIATETASGIQQLEAAAGNMKSLSSTMAEIVGRYKIHGPKSGESG